MSNFNELHGNDNEKKNYEGLLTTAPIFDSIEAIINHNIGEYGDTAWMTDVTTGRSMSYKELLEAVQLVSLAMKEMSIGEKNVPVLVTASNDLRLAIFIFALWRVGGCVAGIPYAYSGESLRKKIVQTGAKFVLADRFNADAAFQAINNSNDCRVIIIGRMEGCIPFSRLLEKNIKFKTGRNTDEIIDLDSPVWMPFSSGTTGEPKGILHTHRSMSHLFIKQLSTRDNNNKTANIGHNKLLMINRFIVSSGIRIMTRATLDHQHIYILSNSSYMSILKGIDQTKPHRVSLYSNILTDICRRCSSTELMKNDFTSVSTICITGESAYTAIDQEIRQIMPNVNHIEKIYGMSETGMITVCDPEAHKKSNENDAMVGAVGKPFPFVKIKFVDNNRNTLGPEEIGGIAVRTPFLMKQYLNAPEKMAESMENGRFFTGDQGSYNTKGNIFIKGRVKDIIKYGTINVYPRDIENVLMMHPSVIDAAVVGRPNEIDGQHPMAFLVIKRDSSVASEELIQFSQKFLTQDEQQLRGGIRFLDRIPRNPAGKILRQDLINMI